MKHKPENMKYKPEKMRSFPVLGRIIAPKEGSSVLKGYRAEARIDDHLLAETTTDSFGRFLLEWPADVDEKARCISVKVFSPWGKLAGETRLVRSELFFPRELTFSATSEPCFPLQASEIGGPPAPSSQVVSKEDLMLFRQAVAAAMEGEYLQKGEAHWVEQYIADLDLVYVLARSSMQRDLCSLGLLRTLLQTAPRWKLPIGKKQNTHGLRSRKDRLLQKNFVSPQDPISLIWGGVILDRFGSEGSEFTWSEHATGFFNYRAFPINAVFNAADAWAKGRISPKDFAGVAKSIIPIDLLWDPTREAWNERPLDLGNLDFDVHHFSERDLCIGALISALRSPHVSSYVGNPPDVGSIRPNAVCEGYTGTLDLLPPIGTQFPASQPHWQLYIDDKPVTVQNWGVNSITIILPANVEPGCRAIHWVTASDPSGFFKNLGDIMGQCGRFFGGASGLAQFPDFFSEDAINLTVVGTPQIRSFKANGNSYSSPLVAEACTDVNLEWEAELSLCAGSSAMAEVTLLVDGNIFASALPLKGSQIVTEQKTAIYTLRVEAFIGGTSCAITEQDLQVQRYEAIHLSAPPGCLDIGSFLELIVQISCPAPVGGMPVTLTSSAPTRLAGGTITIPEGSMEDIIELAAGQEIGEATITATAPEQQSASLKRMVANTPQISAITPLEIYACQPFPLRIDGSCLGDFGQSEVSLTASDGTRIRGNIIPNQTNILIDVDFPALEVGEYMLSVSLPACGKIGFAGTTLKVNEKPLDIKEFWAVPSQIVLCAISIKLTWRVDSARQVRILRDGALIPGSERTRSECSLWEESFDDPQLQSNNVEYTLEAYPSSGSPMKTAQALVRAASHTAFVGLAQEGGSTAYIYGNDSVPDPLASCQVKNAIITNVRNNSGFNISLAHGGPGASFFIINNGGSTSAFNGMPVKGNWSAQVGGSVGSLPSGITIKVDWASP